MTGIDWGDGQGLVPMVGPGWRPRNHDPVLLIGDNEYTVSLGVKAFDNDLDADGCWLPSCYITQNISN